MHEGGAGCRCGECQRLTVGISGWCPTWPQFKKYNHHKLKSYKPYIISSFWGSAALLHILMCVWLFDVWVGVHVLARIEALLSMYQDLGGCSVGGCGWASFLTTWPQVLYLFGIVSPNGAQICRKKWIFIKQAKLFFLDLLCKVRNLNCTW